MMLITTVYVMLLLQVNGKVICSLCLNVLALDCMMYDAAPVTNDFVLVLVYTIVDAL